MQHNFFIEFIIWHYSRGLRGLLGVCLNILEFFYHYFSISHHLLTLFLPFKRTHKVKVIPGFSFSDVFDRITFNLLSRIMGAIIRGGVISLGVLFLFLWTFVASLLIWTWLCVPIVSLPWFIRRFASDRLMRIVKQQVSKPKRALATMLATPWGLFMLKRMGVARNEIIQSVEEQGLVPAQQKGSYLDIFLAIFDASKNMQQFFLEHSIARSDIIWISDWFRRQESESYKRRAFWERDFLLHMPTIGKTWTYGYTPILDKYTDNMIYEETPFQEVIGRAKEILAIERILMKKTQANVAIIGEPGVGKHTLVTYIAHLIDQGRVFPTLESKRVVRLNLEELFSDEIDNTQRKATLSKLLEEAAGAGNIILVIDEFDRFVASSADRIDMSDVFVHELGSFRLHCIALLVPGAYHQYVEHDKTLASVFEVVEMRSLTQEETREVVSDILPSFENRSIYFLFEALRALIDDTDRLVKNIPFPEKAINTLDQIMTMAKTQGKIGAITAGDIKSYLTEITHVPMTLVGDDKQKLLRLEDILHEQVIGQNEAVSAVAQALRRARSDTSDRGDKPIGTFLFLGPTGVGKTETAKALARVYFSNVSTLTRFDMSQYQGDEAVKQILGDFFTGKIGVVAQAISDHPYSVLLLDELEKASIPVINTFLTALDEGYITDFQGKKIYLSNMIVIATSNAGSEFIREGLSQRSRDSISIQKDVVEYIQKKGIFSPEFLNRFDGVIVFHPLTVQHTQKILTLALSRFTKSVFEKHGIILTISPQTQEVLLKEGFDPEFGGRALTRAIARLVENPFAQKVLSGEALRGKKVLI